MENREIAGWSVDKLHEHIRTLIDERDKRYEQGAKAQKEAVETALASAERAVEKAEAINTAWRINANEWRAAMSDKDKLYLPKAEARSDFRTMLALTGLMVTIMSVVVGIVIQLFKH